MTPSAGEPLARGEQNVRDTGRQGHFRGRRPHPFLDGAENQKNIHGKQFIECFYAYHTGLSPKDQLWEKSKFEKYSADDLYRDLFIDGPDDVAIVQSTYLKDFYKTASTRSSATPRWPSAIRTRFIVNGAFDPRDGEKALEYIHFLKEPTTSRA